ncbi:MAG: serine/threonine protein kinase [Planctomycetota bacterium]|jgi:serine/threonine protein kinase
MINENEKTFAKIARDYHYCSEGMIERAMKIKEKYRPDTPIPIILVDEKYMTDAEFLRVLEDTLLVRREKVKFAAERMIDIRLAVLAVDLGYCQRDAIAACMKEQLLRAAGGNFSRLIEIAAEFGVLEGDAAAEVYRIFTDTTLICPACLGVHDVAEKKGGSELVCGRCGKVLTVPPKTPVPELTTLAGKPPSEFPENNDMRAKSKTPPSKKDHPSSQALTTEQEKKHQSTLSGVIERAFMPELSLPERHMSPGRKTAEEIIAHTKTDERYILVREIGRGGMGVVFEAVDRDLRRRVAMKIIHPSKSIDRNKVKRFLEEAQITGQLEHPNIIPVHEVGINRSGNLFFTMKLVQGHAFADILDEYRAGDEKIRKLYTRHDLLGIFRRILDGVAFAHSHGVIHRDLKPHNIMIGEYGEVLIMDWGLAKVFGHPDTRSATVEVGGKGAARMKTRLGAVVGTPAYLPPEQAAGKPEEMDERSDVYSLGAILYEILVLVPPFDADTGDQIITKVLTEEATAPREIDDTVPSELEHIAMKCLNKDKRRRYQSVAGIIEDTDSYRTTGRIDEYHRAEIARQKKERQAIHLRGESGEPSEIAKVLRESIRGPLIFAIIVVGLILTALLLLVIFVK